MSDQSECCLCVQVSLAGQTGKAPGSQEVKMLPTAEAGRPDALDTAAAPAPETSPSKPPAAAKHAPGEYCCACSHLAAVLSQVECCHNWRTGKHLLVCE